MARDDSTQRSDSESTQCPEELRKRAEANVETAELDIQRSDEAVEELTRTMSDFKAMWDKNGFGESLVTIFRAPARGKA